MYRSYPKADLRWWTTADLADREVTLEELQECQAVDVDLSVCACLTGVRHQDKQGGGICVTTLQTFALQTCKHLRYKPANVTDLS
jgi:hypothetical protein